MRISRMSSKSILICLVIFGASHKCFADSVVYSNIGTGGDVYSDIEGWAVIGAASPYGFGYQLAPAFPFTPASTVYFTELDIALKYGGVGANSMTVDLMSDNSGPGSVLESWSISGLPFETTCCSLTALSGNGTIPLESGSTYWVGVLPGADDSFGSWAGNTTGVSATEFENEGTGWSQHGFNSVGAFEVQGSPVPEPGTLSLLGTGLLGLAGLMRRKLRGFGDLERIGKPRILYRGFPGELSGGSLDLYPSPRRLGSRLYSRSGDRRYKLQMRSHLLTTVTTDASAPVHAAGPSWVRRCDALFQVSFVTEPAPFS